jgi:hypothetical protein
MSSKTYSTDDHYERVNSCPRTLKGDAEGFRSAVRESINKERRKNRQVVARDLQRLPATYSGLLGRAR